MGAVISFAARAERAGYRIHPAPQMPRSRAHLPPLRSLIEVWTPEHEYLGVGEVIAFDPDPNYLVVSVCGERHITHWADCWWEGGRC